MTCKAATATGTRCKHDPAYGQLCGIHYRMLENLPINNLKLLAIAHYLNQRQYPLQVTVAQFRANDSYLCNSDADINDALTYRRILQAA